MKRYILVCEQGIYMGTVDGTTSWSREPTTTCGCTSIAVTFASVEALRQHVARWSSPPPSGWRPVEVRADAAGYATIAACNVALSAHLRFADHLAVCDDCNQTQHPCALGKALIEQEAREESARS